MPTEAPEAVKLNAPRKGARRKNYIRIPYVFIRMSVSLLVAFSIIVGVSLWRVQQYKNTELANDDEYARLLSQYNDLTEQADELSAQLDEEKAKSDSKQRELQQELSQKTKKLNEQGASITQSINEYQKKADDLQKKLDELEKAKEDIVNQLNGISYLPDIDSASLVQAAPKAVSYASNPGQMLALKLDSLNGAAESELSSFQELADAVEKDMPILKGYPTTWPVKGRVTSSYGTRQNPMGGSEGEFHTGMDIAAPSGTDVKATGGGVVKLASYDGGYGNLVIIDHGMGLETYYGHNSQLLVKAGDKVARGQVISKSGSTGYSTGPHVHYEVRLNGKPVNPEKYVVLSK